MWEDQIRNWITDDDTDTTVEYDECTNDDKENND